MNRGGDTGIPIHNRDTSLLVELFESRVASRDQLYRLFFADNIEVGKKRLQQLKSAGLIKTLLRKDGEQSVYTLGKAGFEYLSAQALLAKYPPTTWMQLRKRLTLGPLKLAHELDVMSVKAAMGVAMGRSSHLRAVTFSVWPQLHRFRVRSARSAKQTLEPDGYLHILQTSPTGLKEHRLFLEVDRSTESQMIVANKALDYLTHYRSGAFAISQGATADRYKEIPFRVLIVCKSLQRRDNLARCLVMGKPTIRALVWLTTRAEVEATPLGAIWVTPGMYLPWPRPKTSVNPEQLKKMALFEPSDIDLMVLGRSDPLTDPL